jgi:hypothetical protein
MQTKSNVHINPRFQQLKTATPVTSHTTPVTSHTTPVTSHNVHVNPNFSARPLPELPNSDKDKKQYYVNPSFLVKAQFNLLMIFMIR